MMRHFQGFEPGVHIKVCRDSRLLSSPTTSRDGFYIQLCIVWRLLSQSPRYMSFQSMLAKGIRPSIAAADPAVQRDEFLSTMDVRDY